MLQAPYLFLSRIAPSFASLRAVSKAFTRSTVARNLFSNFGSSQRRSELSRTSCCNKANPKKKIPSAKLSTLNSPQENECINSVSSSNKCPFLNSLHYSVMNRPACELLSTDQDCFPGKKSSASERCFQCYHLPLLVSVETKHTEMHPNLQVQNDINSIFIIFIFNTWLHTSLMVKALECKPKGLRSKSFRRDKKCSTVSDSIRQLTWVQVSKSEDVWPMI